MRSLNRRFRGKDKATDVLSFPAPEFVNGFAGDIAISLDEATRNAKEHGHSLNEEVRILVLHGLLHLAGYDHESDGGEMAEREQRVRSRLALPAALIAIFLFAGSERVFAQSEISKIEVGVQFSTIRLGEMSITEPGFGGRFTYNVNKHVAVEAEGNFFPRAVKDSFGETLQGGRKTEGLFGVKLGARAKRIGVFGKVRPGFVRFSNFSRPGVKAWRSTPSAEGR